MRSEGFNDTRVEIWKTPSDAVTLTVVLLLTTGTVCVKVALCVPAGIVKVCPGAPALLVLRVTFMPPVGATPTRNTVPVTVVVEPVETGFGVKVRLKTAGCDDTALVSTMYRPVVRSPISTLSVPRNGQIPQSPWPPPLPPVATPGHVS